jgi:hypothetical protein
LEGFQKTTIRKAGGVVTNFAQETVPAGVSPDARNIRFTLSSVATRYGLQQQIETAKQKAVNSIGMLIRSGLAAPQIPLLFNSDASLSFETAVLDALGLPLATGITQDLAPTLFSWNQGTYLQMAATFQRMYLANGNLKTGVGSPAVTDGTFVDPLSQRPFGETWQPATAYVVGECITPNPATDFIYRCTVKGISGAVTPVFPQGDGATVAEASGLTWQENTPFAANIFSAPPQPTVVRVPGGGAFAAARDVYIVMTYLNGFGETTISAAFVFVNTTLNDAFSVTPPAPLVFMADAVGTAAYTGFRLYEADVATGAASPGLAAFKLEGGTTPPGSGAVTIFTTGTGAAPPSVNTAAMTAAGVVDAGPRFLSIIFVNRFGNLSGFNFGAVIPANINGTGLQAYIGKVPLGPNYVTQRLVVLGAANTSAGGPFFMLDTDEISPGEISFVINDNVTTNVIVNFSEDSLSTATDVTNNTRKIKLPPQNDIQFIKTLKRLAVCGEPGQPSLLRFSNPNDPESFYGDTGYQYIARDDGQRMITTREFDNGVVVAFKERAAYQLPADATEPLNWGANRLWEGSGPAGPRAVDSQDHMLAFAGKAGAYVWQGNVGDPLWISQEITDIWAGNIDKNLPGINWDYGHLIKVVIDPIEKEIHFFVPYGQSTTNNLDLVLDYKRGLEPPVHFSAFSGKEMSLPPARKWAVNDIAATDAIRAVRRFQMPDGTIFQDCMLVCSPANEGVVNTIMPAVFNDNGQGYNSYYDTATIGDGEVVYRFGAVAVSGKGKGEIKISKIPYVGDPIQIKKLQFALDKNRYYIAKGRGQGRQWGMEISNQGAADAHWEFFSCDIFLAPVAQTEISSGNRQ